MAYQNILQTIGNTPIVRLNAMANGLQANLFAKLEFMNPGGSVKDRIGHWLIDDFVKKGLLKPGGTIVEGTSGNTGIGLAIAAAVRGYKCIFVLSDKMSKEKVQALRAFGAKVYVCPVGVEPQDPRSYYSVARRLASEIPDAIYVDQYNNTANRDCHEQTTGPEILKQMPEMDAFVACIGTGGTVCGIARAIKKAKPHIPCIAIDPIGSIVHEYFKTGKWTHFAPYKVEGIGEDFIPKNYDLTVIDDIVQVDDKTSFMAARDLLLKEGIYAGGSSGTAVAGMIQWVRSQGDKLKGKNILTLLPDSGNRYLSKQFDDGWLKSEGFLESGKMISGGLEYVEGAKRHEGI